MSSNWHQTVTQQMDNTWVRARPVTSTRTALFVPRGPPPSETAPLEYPSAARRHSAPATMPSAWAPPPPAPERHPGISSDEQLYAQQLEIDESEGNIMAEHPEPPIRHN